MGEDAPSLALMDESLELEAGPLGLSAVAHTMDPDEKAYFLVEMNMPKSDYKGRARYQLIMLNRNDQVVPWVGTVDDEDGEFPAFRIPSYWEHTVAELQEMAEAMRMDNKLEQIMKQAKEESTLIKDVITLSERRKAIRENRSTFGAGKTAGTQRIGFHPERK